MEQWKIINDYPEYMISNLGNVRRGEKILKQSSSHNGYKLIGLCKNGKEKKCRVHRLVAQTFIPNPNNYPVVNHINKDKTDNRVENLEWCTNEYNNQYSHNRAVIGYDRNTLDIELYDSMRGAEKQMGYSHSDISAVCLGKKKSYLNKKWFFTPPTIEDFLENIC